MLGGHGERSGTASSLSGFAVFTVAGLVTPVAGLVGIGSVTPVAVVLVATAVAFLAGAVLVVRD